MEDAYPRILIVEDEEKWQKVLTERCEFIKNLPLDSIVCTKKPEETEEQLNNYTFDLAITDFLLDDNKTEYQWRNLARSLQKYHIPIIVVSGYIDDIDLITEMINEYGVVGVYHKGKIDLYKLSEHVERIIGKRISKENMCRSKLEDMSIHKIDSEQIDNVKSKLRNLAPISPSEFSVRTLVPIDQVCDIFKKLIGEGCVERANSDKDFKRDLFSLK